MMHGKIEQRLFSSAEFDGLMDDILNRRVSLLVPNDESAGWRRIDWNSLTTMVDGTQVDSSSMGLWSQPSPMDVITIGNRVVHMKRDDQLRLPGSQLSGNKVSKSWLRARFSVNYSICNVYNVGLRHQRWKLGPQNALAAAARPLYVSVLRCQSRGTSVQCHGCDCGGRALSKRTFGPILRRSSTQALCLLH